VAQEFLETLKSRREAAKRKLDSARQLVTSAEEEVAMWDSAVRTEESARVSQVVDALDDSAGNLLVLDAPHHALALSLTDVRRKSDILKNALRAGSALKIGDLAKRVAPAVSKSSVYALVKQMIADGVLTQDPEGRVSLSTQERATMALKDLKG